MVSNEFNSSFLGGGSMVSQECICGRVHFCNPELSHGDYEEGEYERYKELEKKYPERYIENEYDCVSYFDYMDNCVVWGCPCGFDEKVENYIWNQRSSILEYYRDKYKDIEREYWNFTKSLHEADFESDEKMSYLEFLNKLRDKKLEFILNG